MYADLAGAGATGSVWGTNTADFDGIDDDLRAVDSTPQGYGRFTPEGSENSMHSHSSSKVREASTPRRWGTWGQKASSGADSGSQRHASLRTVDDDDQLMQPQNEDTSAALDAAGTLDEAASGDWTSANGSSVPEVCVMHAAFVC